MHITTLRALGLILCTTLLAAGLVACGSPAPVSGKYSRGILESQIFSDIEFSENGQVVLYCAKYKNAYGTYAAEGGRYKITIESHENDSRFYDWVEEIKNDCNVYVTPIDENTVSMEIKAKELGVVYLGQTGSLEFKKE